MNPFELQKRRELIFSDDPAIQLDQAYLLLSGLENLKVERCTKGNCLVIHYSVEHYSLNGLKKALSMQGFQFKLGLLGIIREKMIGYCEDVQYHNLSIPEYNTKQNQSELFVKIYDEHPHGDHDDTPKELREFK
jgi:hypothetical protein